MKFSFVSFLILCISTITFAQDPSDAGIASSRPLLNSVVALGSTLQIHWVVTNPNATTIEAISLLKGDPNALTLIIPNILTNGSVPVTDLGYNWTVPVDLTPAADYAFSFTGNNSGVTYSPFFTLQ
ncbi:hypothetical protein BD770DRAFT_380440 [Pilaira anomala]|nr:hypothetical protein BD770DRAFT_380440 [Pilaira anomala]